MVAQQFDPQAFRRWLAYNAAPGLHRAEPGTAQTRLLQAVSLAVGESALATLPVVAGGVLSGSGAASALQLDDAYTAASGPARSTALQQSPATGCAMLMTLARNKCGYDPSTPAVLGSAPAFLGYVNQILVCPLFSAALNDEVTPTFSGPWPQVIQQIAGYYVGLGASDLALVQQSLWNIAGAAASSPSTNQTVNVFSQSTLDVSGQISVFMYHTLVNMVTTVTPGGKHEPDTVANQAQLTLYRVKLQFDSQNWAAQADAVQQQTDASLRSWLGQCSTPQGGLPVNWLPHG